MLTTRPVLHVTVQTRSVPPMHCSAVSTWHGCPHTAAATSDSPPPPPATGGGPGAQTSSFSSLLPSGLPATHAATAIKHTILMAAISPGGQGVIYPPPAYIKFCLPVRVHDGECAFR